MPFAVTKGISTEPFASERDFHKATKIELVTLSASTLHYLTWGSMIKSCEGMELTFSSFRYEILSAFVPCNLSLSVNRW